jgi:hypothetical protein
MPFSSNNLEVTSSWLHRLAALLLALVPLAVYLVVISSLHRNLPIYDDYIVQLEIARLKTAPGLLDKINILFSQLNEHRLVYTRCCFWLVHTLGGTLSYSALIAIGNASLLGIWLLFGRLLYRLGVPLIAYVPVSWLLFQFQYYSNSLWAMASLQNLTIHFLYLLLFMLLLSQRRVAWVAGWGVAAWLCFTSGNGFVALALGAGALIYQRRWADAFAWTVFSIGLVLLYFWSYQRPPDFPAADTSTLLDKLQATLIFLGTHLDAYPQSAGMGFQLLNGLAICVPVFLLTAWSSWRLVARWRLKQPLTGVDSVLLICVLMSGFVVLSAVAAVQNRLNFMGWVGLTESRYRLYSTMLLVAGYIQLLAFAGQQQWNLHRLGWVSLALSGLVWVGIYNRQISAMYLFHSQSLANYHNWTQLQADSIQAFVATVFAPSGRDADELERIRRGVSLVPQRYPLHTRVVQSFTEVNDTYLIENANVPNSQSPYEWNMLIFWASDHFLLFPVRRLPNRDWRTFWLHQTWFGSGFQAQTIKWTMKKQPYRLGFLRNRSDSLTVYRTPHMVQP